MRERLRQYIERLFANAPKTQSAQELKEEMLQNLLDKYDDLIGEGKSEEDAYAAAIAGIGDVDGLLSGLAPQTVGAQAAQSVKPAIKQKSPEILAIAIVLYVLAVVPNIVFGGITGVVLMFALLAIATAMIIMNRTVVHPTRSALVAVGVALCILCPTPVMFMDNVLGVMLLFVLIAAGVGLIVYGMNEKFSAAPVSETDGGDACPRASKLGGIALAVICALLVAGAVVNDATRHKQVVWHGVTAEIISDAEDNAVEMHNGAKDAIEDSVNEAEAAGAAIIADRHDEDVDGDHDDDDDRDDKDDEKKDAKKAKKDATASSAIMEGAAEVQAAGITEIEVDWVGGGVKVANYNGDTIAISETASKTLTDRQKLRYTIKGNKLSISYCEDTVHVWDWLDIDKLSMPEKTLTLQLPAGAFPELTINAVSAKVDVSGVAVDKLDVESVSGDVTVTDISGRKLSVQTTSGKATVRGADVTKLDLESTSGAIDVTESRADEVDVETVSASAGLGLIVAPKKLEVETVSGGTTLALPKDATDFSVRSETVSGDFSCAFPAVQQKGLCVVGSGAYQYEFTSVSGDLQIVVG